MRTRWIASLALPLVALAAPVLGAQETEESNEPQEPERPDVRDELDRSSMRRNDLVDELRQLFLEVERKLEEVDDQLASAGAGEIPLEMPEDSGLDDLLRASKERCEQAVGGIERILEIAQQLGGSGGGSGGQPQGPSPLDQERDRGPQEREKTPEAPEPSKQDHEGQKPQDSSRPDREPGENRPDEPRTDETGPPVPPGDDAGEWGFLPERMQERFRNQGGDDLPPRYRDWIDAYYRRLNARRP